MTSGRKKSEAMRTPPADHDKGVEQDDEDQGEDEEHEEEYEEHEEVAERPKLDDGFYEIEEIRKKRVRKGYLQYLIKWRGWPENANTWEPVDNLQSCKDIIDAFEESLPTGKSSRKRKRKYGGPHLQIKKRRFSGKLEAAGGESPSLTAHPTYNNDKSSRNRVEGHEEDNEDDKGTEDVNASKGKSIELPVDKGSINCQLKSQKQEANQPEFIHAEINRTGFTEENSLLVLFPDNRPSEEDVSTDRHSKTEHTQPSQSRFTGARKRKSGSVRRFKQDQISCDLEETQTATARSTVNSHDKGELLGTEDIDLMGDAVSQKNKLEDSVNPTLITKILRPIGYSASISNNVQDVSVTFSALRADGKEVLVDNKFLKLNNPQLLIGFYEQHVRYNPPLC